MSKTYLTKLSEKLIYLGFQCLLPRGLSDLIATPCGRPYDAVTQPREIPACKSSFLEVHLAQGVTTWVPTHAPQVLVTHPVSVSAFLSHYAHGSSPGRGPLPDRICPRDSSEVAWVLHESGYSLLVLGIWPWSHLSLFLITALRYRGPRPPRPYRGLWLCRPLHDLPFSWVSGDGSIDAWVLATPTPSDAYTWRRPKRSTLTFLLGAPLVGPTICLTLTLVHARKRVDTKVDMMIPLEQLIVTFNVGP